MLPLLALPMCDTGSGQKRKREEAIYFKAYKNGDYRKLSNLFGPVEWKFQAAKFKVGSGVREWLLENASKEWTSDEFDAARLSMKHDGKLKSYVAPDGELATGLLAQMCSLIVRNPESNDARARLRYILQTDRIMSKEEAIAWVLENVNEELQNEYKDALMLTLLREKFQIEKYKNLLLETGDVNLHEGRGRGAPNRYEFHPLNDKQEKENEELIASGNIPKWSAGGDALGKMMMVVRAELVGVSLNTSPQTK
jgi:predicted NAD-dependent protein-ADP-ribosyltransferase YbiA (DUF1768 family)